MCAQVNSFVLENRYKLITPLLSEPRKQPSEEWIGADEYENEYIVKIWPFISEDANDLQRALWDLELRTMYRVSSSPGASECLMTMREAGLDHANKCFVMIMQGQGTVGYQSLRDTLHRRNLYPWLSNANVEARDQLWAGLKRIAQGILLLHTQTVLHRNVDAVNIILQPKFGPESFRLGGFEWSVRIGELQPTQPPAGWSSPPEFSDPDLFGYSPENDWYGFGMLAARCLINIEACRDQTPVNRHTAVTKAIDKASGRYLSDIEKVLLERLIARTRPDRLTRAYEILAALDDVINSLRPATADISDKPLILAYNPTSNMALLERCVESGFVPDPAQPKDFFNPNDAVHCIRLSTFIQEDLTDAKFYFVNDNFILVGKKLILKVSQFQYRDPQSAEINYSWDLAYCVDVRDLQWNEGGTTCTTMPSHSIDVRTVREVFRDRMAIVAQAQSWERYLPHVDQSAGLRASLGRFHDFIRCTNQIELLMRDSELYQYKVLESVRDPEKETLVICEAERLARPVMEILRPEGGLIEFLQRESESGKDNSDKVVLSSRDSLRFDIGNRIEPKDCFTIRKYEKREMKDEQGNKKSITCVVLERSLMQPSLLTAPPEGWIRTFGMFGQVDLIRRRKEAIDRLVSHSYLLTSLVQPGNVFMDTGNIDSLQDVQSERVDEAKQAVMRDVLRTRPIYTLQGPPGTGKTTMVAHLLRQIFNDDRVAQVLITAQAHSAVDVLRDKVRTEAFAGVEASRLPLAIRLGRDNLAGAFLADSVEDVAMQTLNRAIDILHSEEKSGSLTSIQVEWLQYAREMKAAIGSHSTEQSSPEFCELVKRGANIVYCTTSAGDLEELARSTQFYDWAIVEEAGKCHGFDLALPLQSGHRWLLIGDQSQLPPYRLRDYQKALAKLEDVVENLKTLPNRAAGLLDYEWIHRWETMTTTEQKEFKDFCQIWLTTFKRLFDQCMTAPLGQARPKLTKMTSEGAMAGMLSSQYRMHPTIGSLISEAYYSGKIRNITFMPDGSPASHVVFPACTPQAIQNKGIVWIDTPSAMKSDIAREYGPLDGEPRYINRYEIKAIKGFLAQLTLAPEYLAQIQSGQAKELKMAVLSPYAQQVRLIRSSLSHEALPQGLVPKQALRGRPTVNDHIGNIPLTHTVDSFQGNEADVILVSLVRNNTPHPNQRPLGFLEDPERMNVLLSRAQRLLVLVGSWDFFWEQVEPMPLAGPARPLWHLRKAMSMLDEWFKTGQAVKLDAGIFVEHIS
jgi:hypothetical protein